MDRFIWGERKIWWKIKKSQSILKMIVTSKLQINLTRNNFGCIYFEDSLRCIRFKTYVRYVLCHWHSLRVLHILYIGYFENSSRLLLLSELTNKVHSNGSNYSEVLKYAEIIKNDKHYTCSSPGNNNVISKDNSLDNHNIRLTQQIYGVVSTFIRRIYNVDAVV